MDSGEWIGHSDVAEYFVGAHNADCDAYEKRIAELEADITRAIKMAKVAIKYLPACDYITDIDGIESISTITTLLCHALAGGNCDEEE